MPDLTQKCRLTGKDFVITEWEQQFLERMGLPLPTLCIDERHKRRLSHRNERSIYKSKCGLCERDMISLYSPEKPHTAYCQDCWWSDKWDSTKYGVDFDFSRPFFEQFKDLQTRVPRLGLLNTKSQNSEFCNITVGNKNCYLVFGGDINEDSLYSVFCFHSKDISDVYWCEECQLIYDCIHCEKCYNTQYAQNSTGCRDSAFLFECRNCTNCFGCVGLRSRDYHIFNKPYKKADYEAKLKSFNLDTWSGAEHMKKEFEKFRLEFPHRDAHIVNCENCVGENIYNGKKCDNCFDVVGPAEDAKDVFVIAGPANDILSSDHIGHKAELFYECVASITGQNCAFCAMSWSGYNNLYSEMVCSCHDMFGCSQMKHHSFCILNKQYKEDEYENLRARIIEHMKKTGEWGEFFPIENSPFAYNETVAQDLFPMTKEETIAANLKWQDEETRDIGSGPKIPDSIHDVTDDILKETLVCEETGRLYKLVPQELKLYRQLEIPVPRYAPETRNRHRMDRRNPQKTWGRKCAKCDSPMQTSYSPDRPEKVYCEKCYLAEVY